MVSREITQELEAFDQSISILDQVAVRDEAIQAKYKQAVQRLVSKVTLEDAAKALQDANLRADPEERRIAQRALSALLDSIPKDAALEVLMHGLSQAEPSTRASALSKMIDTASNNPDIINAIVRRVADQDTKVAKIAIDFAQTQVLSESAIGRTLVIATLKDILDRKQSLDTLASDYGTVQLRIWELASNIYKKSKDEATKKEMRAILRSLFLALEAWNEDVLYVLNLLEIAANIPRDVVSSLQGNIIPTLLRYAKEEEIVADDALRVLAALHFSPSSIATRTQFFECLERRMSQEFFSLGSLDVFALFCGATSETLEYALENQPQISTRWLSLVYKFAHDGNETPRNVALDALSKALRGGSLLRDPFSSDSTIFIAEEDASNDSERFSLLVWRFLSNDLPQLLKSITAAVKSLHPQVQIAGYQSIRLLVSQNSRWGISKVFEYIPRDVLLGRDMPSPNTNYQVVEARKIAISSCALKFLDDPDDADLVRAIKQFISASLQGTLYRLNVPTVDVATMHA